MALPLNIAIKALPASAVCTRLLRRWRRFSSDDNESRRAPQIVDVEFLPAFVNDFLGDEFDILRSFDPALKVGDRAAIGGDHAQHLTDRQFGDRFAALDERHRAFCALDIERLMICQFHRIMLLSSDILALLCERAHILAQFQFFRLRLGRGAQTDVHALDLNILRREFRQIAKDE
jgi:hypothetical protein